MSNMMTRYHDFYLFLSSTDDPNTNPDNDYKDFTLRLPTDNILSAYNENGDRQRWSVGLFDTYFTPSVLSFKDINVIIMCDLIVTSYIKGDSLPVLRVLPGNVSQSSSSSSSLYLPYYIPVTKHSFNTVRIYLDSLGGEFYLVNQFNFKTTCTLHFQVTYL